MKWLSVLFLLVFCSACGDGGSSKSQPLEAQLTQCSGSSTQSETLAIAVDGSGFFILNGSSENLYSRSALLQITKDGYLINECGFALLGFLIDDNGNPSAILSPIRVLVEEFDQLLIDNDGKVYSIASDYEVEIAQIALSNFSSPYNLKSEYFGLFLASNNSGLRYIGVPNNPTLGKLSINTSDVSAWDMTLNLEAEDGFIALESPTSEKLYASSVELFFDAEGYLVDEHGNSLLIYPVSNSDGFALPGDESIDEQTTSKIQIASKSLIPQPTSFVDISFHLDPALARNSTLELESFPSSFNYNVLKSTTIFDSLGNTHTLSLYFAAQESIAEDTPKHWVLVVQIDGENVGDPNPSLAPPSNTLPTLAAYNLYFNGDHSLSISNSDEVLVSNWVPLDESGEPNGALGPQPVLAGGSVNIANPATSSNFVIDISKLRLNANEFFTAENDGYPTGKMTSLLIDDCGQIVGTFSNDVGIIFGQVPLHYFDYPNDLNQLGETLYGESNESGVPSHSPACTQISSGLTGDTMEL